jgi:hypothetical protein
LRRSIGAFVLATLLIPLSASAEEFAACWVSTVFDPVFGDNTQVTRCRITGGDVVDYASDDTVPSVLYPSAGVDVTGDCWYLTSAVTNWVFLDRFGNGDAILGLDPDPSVPGGIAVATDRIPRCTAEPGVTVDPSLEAWRYVTQYVHAPPTPEVSPAPGDGVTGLETYVGVGIPPVHETSITSATGLTLDIHIEVSGVAVDWGDQRVDRFPADEEALAGYPDGVAVHIYEVKDLAGYPLTISYDWVARWRVNGGPWEFLTVPDTSTTLDYPVAEIVSVLTD